MPFCIHLPPPLMASLLYMGRESPSHPLHAGGLPVAGLLLWTAPKVENRVPVNGFKGFPPSQSAAVTLHSTGYSCGHLPRYARCAGVPLVAMQRAPCQIHGLMLPSHCYIGWHNRVWVGGHSLWRHTQRRLHLFCGSAWQTWALGCLSILRQCSPCLRLMSTLTGEDALGFHSTVVIPFWCT